MILPHTGRALADAAPVPYWLDRPERPDPLPPLTGAHAADLLVIGGGYSGLWAALLAKQADPDADVLLVEAGTCGWAASGRNGGFCAASLTHGLANGVDRFPREIAELDRLGRENLADIAATVDAYGIDCDFERTGELAVAVEPYQLAGLAEDVELARRYGHDTRLLDRDEVRAEVDSPTYLGGLWDRDRVAMLDPAKLAWGCAAPASTSVCASTSTPGSPACAATAPPCAPPPSAEPGGPPASSAPGGSSSPPTRSRRCCAGCAPGSSPSTTTP